MKVFKRFKWLGLVSVAAMVLCLTIGSTIFAAGTTNVQVGKWVSGDFHNHTYLTDGSKTEEEVMMNAFENFGLDWIANSEHGGTSSRTPFGVDLEKPLWRWYTLKEESFPIIQYMRMKYADKLIIQGLEWNVPSHEHASVGIIAKDGTDISNFEYIFDQSDSDTSRLYEGLMKMNKTHQDAVAGAKFLQDAYGDSSYFIINHPSRKLGYSIADIRDFNNAAPDVCFGLEGIPGHQKEASRGGYGSDLKDLTYRARTYGGADYMIAEVGGLWDALLGEGRKFWTFVNSDFHNTDGDFYPGEYSKSYTKIYGDDYAALVDGLRSGNTFAVNGDLINALDFTIKDNKASSTMGQTLTTSKDNKLTIIIRFKSPSKNNNGDAVKVDHIDLVAGDVTEKAKPGTDAYNKDTNDSTKVIASFDSSEWKTGTDGWNTITYTTDEISNDKYFRLRGTNLGKGIENETDTEGNPLMDDLTGANDPEKAWKDLWFYSNPIFVSVNK